MNPTLEKCNYPTLDVMEDKGDEDARRRYELGLLLQAAKKESDSAGK